MRQHFDRENAIRTDRIAHYEEIMDRIIRITKLDGITPGVYASVLPELKELEDYYTSPEWQEDYAADEAGLLPEGLKRGVLSQDGISVTCWTASRTLKLILRTQSSWYSCTSTRSRHWICSWSAERSLRSNTTNLSVN